MNRVSGMPFRWSINPYRGCSHGCVFCYARRTHWFLDEDGLDRWSTKIFAKVNAPRYCGANSAAPRGGARKSRLARRPTPTRRSRAAIASHGASSRHSAMHAHRSVSSPSRRSFNATSRSCSSSLRAAGVTVCVSVATTDAALARKIEPGVAPPCRRLRTLRRLVDSGIRCGVLLAPILPGLTDARDSLRAVVRAARDHGAEFLGSSGASPRPGHPRIIFSVPWAGVPRPHPAVYPDVRRAVCSRRLSGVDRANRRGREGRRGHRSGAVRAFRPSAGPAAACVGRRGTFDRGSGGARRRGASGGPTQGVGYPQRSVRDGEPHGRAAA